MKTDELRDALGGLAGDAPDVSDAFGTVTRRARRDRIRNRGAVLVAVACVVAVAGFGVSRRSSAEHITLGNSTHPSTPARTKVADLSWTRVAAPETAMSRTVGVNGQTYAVGSYGYAASIQELTADGHATAGFRDSISHQSASIGDLIAVRGALVAVGGDEHGAAAWRSTDNGATWRRLTVEQPAPEGNPVGGVGPQGPAQYASIGRIFAKHGVLYAVGVPVFGGPITQCLRSVWTSTDGTSFTLAPRGVACGGTDAADGPAGIVSLLNENAFVIIHGAAPAHPISPGEDAHIQRIAGDDHGYVAVGTAGPNIGAGDSSGAIWWSADGQRWERVVTASPPAVPAGGYASFTGVAHTSAGWMAVGFQAHQGDANASDAILWTSADGRHWVKDARDHGTFEQDARANGIGVTADGFAIWGEANMSGSYTPTDPGHMSFVLWLGSSTPPGAPVGIVEGTMREIGGPAPGLHRGIAGTLTATAADGTETNTHIGSGGPFSIVLPPGNYTVVGRSPLYENGKAACDAGEPVKVTASVVTHVVLVCPIR